MQLIKDAKEFNALAYFEFIAALVAVMKRIWESLNIPLCFWFDFFQRSCKFFDYNYMTYFAQKTTNATKIDF